MYPVVRPTVRAASRESAISLVEQRVGKGFGCWGELRRILGWQEVVTVTQVCGDSCRCVCKLGRTKGVGQSRKSQETQDPRGNENKKQIQRAMR